MLKNGCIMISTRPSQFYKLRRITYDSNYIHSHRRMLKLRPRHFTRLNEVKAAAVLRVSKHWTDIVVAPSTIHLLQPRYDQRCTSIPCTIKELQCTGSTAQT